MGARPDGSRLWRKYSGREPGIEDGVRGSTASRLIVTFVVMLFLLYLIRKIEERTREIVVEELRKWQLSR